MSWIILTFVFGWLLCGAWGLRMAEKEDNELIGRGESSWATYLFGPILLVFVWVMIWPPRLLKFAKDVIKGIATAWKEATNAN